VLLLEDTTPHVSRRLLAWLAKKTKDIHDWYCPHLISLNFGRIKGFDLSTHICPGAEHRAQMKGVVINFLYQKEYGSNII
jgi:hypothetical protein